MLTSLALIFLVGLSLGSIFKAMKLPSLLGMILTGIILSPYALNLLDDKILLISADLRQFALVIILTRAGLNVNIDELKKVGRPAILMSFIPATCEIVATVIFAPMFLDVTYTEAAIIGCVIAAVSPAVIVPRMINLIEKKYGTKQGIPQMIMAGASIDDVFVIVLFSVFTTLEKSGEFKAVSLIQIPISIITGLLVGLLIGFVINIFFKKIHLRDSIKVIIMLSIAFLLLELQNIINGVVPYSGLLAIMSMSIMILNRNNILARRLSQRFSKLWIAAEVLLFVLVGATVDLKYAASAGIMAVLIIFVALAFRMLGVLLCLIKTKLNKKERLFCVFGYMPKATVQAAIGGLALSQGLDCGQVTLTVAVLSIIITAPLGAILIDLSYKKLLQKE